MRRRQAPFVYNPFPILVEPDETQVLSTMKTRVENMPRKKRVTRSTQSTGKRKKKRTHQIESEKAHNRALIAILTLLFFLHLIDDKTFASVTSTLTPKKAKSHKEQAP